MHPQESRDGLSQMWDQLLLICVSVLCSWLSITKQQWTVEAVCSCCWCCSRRLMMRLWPRQLHIFPARSLWFNAEVVSACSGRLKKEWGGKSCVYVCVISNVHLCMLKGRNALQESHFHFFHSPLALRIDAWLKKCASSSLSDFVVIF